MQEALLARAWAVALALAGAQVAAAEAMGAQLESVIDVEAQVTLRGRMKKKESHINLRPGADRNRDCTSGGGFSSRGGGGQTCYVRHFLPDYSTFANLRQSCGGIGHMSRYALAFSLCLSLRH